MTDDMSREEARRRLGLEYGTTFFLAGVGTFVVMVALRDPGLPAWVDYLVALIPLTWSGVGAWLMISGLLAPRSGGP